MNLLGIMLVGIIIFWQFSRERLRREVRFYRGYDCITFECIFGSKKCIPGHGGSHGKHGVEIAFYVKGKKGAVQFKLSTGWLPYYKNVSNCFNIPVFSPLPIDLGYHSYTPQYKGQPSFSPGRCTVLRGRRCYYDGSGTQAEDAYYILVNRGEEALWEFLEAYYYSIFYSKPYPEIKHYPKPLREGGGNDKQKD